MNPLFVITLIVAAIAVLSGAVILFAEEADTKTLAKVAGVGLAGLTLVGVLLSSMTIVGTKSVGIVTSFGRPTGTLSNGLHWTAPWASVTEFDAAIQTDNHAGADKGDDTPCTTVRLANSSTACVDNSIRWRIRQAAADDLFRDYKDFDRVRDSLVTRELNAALNAVFSAYDPLKALDDTSRDRDAFRLDKLAEAATDALKSKIGGQVEVLNVIIPLIRFDAQTQDKVNAYQAAKADTAIAKQREETAKAEALANAALTGSVNNSPNVLVSKCLDILAEARKANYALPAGFNCWPTNQGALIAVK